MTGDEAVQPIAARRVWPPGVAPVAVVMISLNEGHNMRGVLDNLKGWAQEVYLVDSYSQDDTVDIALEYGVHVVQRRFRDFGDQWSFALRELPIRSPWTMKLDPDERITEQLKEEIVRSVGTGVADGYVLNIRLFFMMKPLPVRLRLVRLWRSGCAVMSSVAVNEHFHIAGKVIELKFEIAHHDSPDLDHWLEKQNRYTTAEALAAHQRLSLADQPNVFGTRLQRRMWMKRHFFRLPFRYSALFFYHYVIQGAWRAGWVGYAWSRLRSDVMRLIDYKKREMQLTGRVPLKRIYGPGRPDRRVPQFD